MAVPRQAAADFGRVDGTGRIGERQPAGGRFPARRMREASGWLTCRRGRGAGTTSPVYTVDKNPSYADDVVSPQTGSDPMVRLHPSAAAEIARVLDRAHGLADGDIAAAIERMLQADVLVVESKQEVFTAMVALKQGQGSFADALVGALGAKAGCSRRLTFDQKAARLSGFELA